jgi:hypothetical protein
VSVCWSGPYGFGGPSPKALSHWWLETSTVKRGMGRTTWLNTAWVDQSYKYDLYKNPGEIQCEEQKDVDEECVNKMTTGSLGVYDLAINNCHDAVDDVLKKCGPEKSDPPIWRTLAQLGLL